MLPATLTHLSIYQISISYANLERTGFLALGLLPRGLRRLETKLEFSSFGDDPTHFLNDWAHAPPYLEYITDFTIQNNRNSYEWLPRTLLECPNLAAREWNLEAVRSLPPLLQSLTLDNWIDHTSFIAAGTNLFLELPKHLKTLSIVSTPIEGILPILPLTLTNLSVRITWPWALVRDEMERIGAGAITSKSYSFWPPSLTSCSFDQHCDMKDFELLPRTLRDLKVHINATPSNRSDRLALPPTLQALEFYFDLGFTPKVDFIAGDFPASLSSLTFARGAIAQTKFPSLDRFLPPSLTSLVLPVFIEKPARQVPKLGPLTKLTTLTLGRWLFQTWSFDSLPRTLTSLTVEGLEAKTFDSPKNCVLSEALPVSLTFLQLVGIDQPSFGNTELPVFSRKNFASMTKLKTLYVQKIAKFPSQILRTLPRSLTNLMLPLSFLDDADAPYIPPRLLRASFSVDGLFKRSLIAEHWPLSATASVPVYETEFLRTVEARAASRNKVFEKS